MSKVVAFATYGTVAWFDANLETPAAIVRAGARAERCFQEFFTVAIHNRHTRIGYFRSCYSFFAWLDNEDVKSLAVIEPSHVADYIAALRNETGEATVKKNLTALRGLFDWLVAGRVLATNPARAVRVSKSNSRTGKKGDVLLPEEALRLLDNIPVLRAESGSKAEVASLVGLRDRALIGVMTYAFAGIGAVVDMRVADFYRKGSVWWLRLRAKRGKRHEMPADPRLKIFIDEYIGAAGICDDKGGALFRSAFGRTDTLTKNPMHRIDAYRMILRRKAKLL
jgi:site-specific recombinase XerC